MSFATSAGKYNADWRACYGPHDTLNSGFIMDSLDSLFAAPFHQHAHFLHSEIPSWSLRRLDRFPLSEFIVQGDAFFDRVWRMIDDSRHYFWLTTYAIDSSPAADTTLHKLIQASRRGVNVALMVDNVQYWAKKELVDQFQQSGGKFLLLNPQFELKSVGKYLTKEVWRRHHQKLIVSDGKGLIGSANIEGHYAGIRYGNCQFQDLNFYSENILLEDYRKHFFDTANFYSFNMDSQLTNSDLLSKFDNSHPSSEFYRKEDYVLLHNDKATGKKQVEDSILDMLDKAKSEIRIISPYYYPIGRFDSAMRKAAQRVGGRIITTGQRDQPVFKSISNDLLFHRLITKGVKVFETRERLLHSKVYMSDGWLNTGSMNNDRWSWQINNEVNIAIRDPRSYDFVEQYFDVVLGKSWPVLGKRHISASRAASISFWQSFLYLSEMVMSRQGMPEEAITPESPVNF